MASSSFSGFSQFSYWRLNGFCWAALVLLQGSAWAQEPVLASPSPATAKSHEGKIEKPSAVVQKHYRCQGGKSLLVRYQLGTRSVHAFAKLQGKMRELPWDGDYKLEHEDDERFSDGQYEMVVQGNFSRVTSVRRLPSKTAAKAGSKGRELLRSCTLPKVQLQAQAQAAARLEKSLEKKAEKTKAESVPAVQPSPIPNPSATPSAGGHEAF